MNKVNKTILAATTASVLFTGCWPETKQLTEDTKDKTENLVDNNKTTPKLWINDILITEKYLPVLDNTIHVKEWEKWEFSLKDHFEFPEWFDLENVDILMTGGFEGYVKNWVVYIDPINVSTGEEISKSLSFDIAAWETLYKWEIEYIVTNVDNPIKVSASWEREILLDETGENIKKYTFTIEDKDWVDIDSIIDNFFIKKQKWWETLDEKKLKYEIFEVSDNEVIIEVSVDFSKFWPWEYAIWWDFNSNWSQKPCYFENIKVKEKIDNPTSLKTNISNITENSAKLSYDLKDLDWAWINFIKVWNEFYYNIENNKWVLNIDKLTENTDYTVIINYETENWKTEKLETKNKTISFKTKKAPEVVTPEPETPEPINQIPTANAWDDITITKWESVILNWTWADPDGNVVSYVWSDENWNIINENTVSPETTTTYTLTVTDNDGATASDMMTVTVEEKEVNNPVEIIIGSDTTVEDSRVAVFGSDNTIDISYNNIKPWAIFSISWHPDFEIDANWLVFYTWDLDLSDEITNLTVSATNPWETTVSTTFPVTILNNN